MRGYVLLKQTAVELGQWAEIYPDVMHDLKDSAPSDILVRVYLEEHEWQAAWDALDKVSSTMRSYYNYGSEILELEVARQSINVMPNRAIPVLIRYARHYIDERGRDNYALAASYLSDVCRAYDDMGEFEKWEMLIADIRREYKKLPALQDELNKAGL